jgi:hypothetical protein
MCFESDVNLGVKQISCLITGSSCLLFIVEFIDFLIQIFSGETVVGFDVSLGRAILMGLATFLNL